MIHIYTNVTLVSIQLIEEVLHIVQASWGSAPQSQDGSACRHAGLFSTPREFCQYVKSLRIVVALRYLYSATLRALFARALSHCRSSPDLLGGPEACLRRETRRRHSDQLRRPSSTYYARARRPGPRRNCVPARRRNYRRGLRRDKVPGLRPGRTRGCRQAGSAHRSPSARQALHSLPKLATLKTRMPLPEAARKEGRSGPWKILVALGRPARGSAWHATCCNSALGPHGSRTDPAHTQGFEGVFLHGSTRHE